MRYLPDILILTVACLLCWAVAALIYRTAEFALRLLP